MSVKRKQKNGKAVGKEGNSAGAILEGEDKAMGGGWVIEADHLNGHNH